MITDRFKLRTTSNPLNGVKFNAKDEAKIAELALAFSNLPDETISVVRSALARQIVEYDVLGEWTEGEAEVVRVSRQEESFLAYQATYIASSIIHAAVSA